MIEVVLAYFLAASPAPVPPQPEKVAIERLVCLPAKEEKLVAPPLMQKTRKNKMFAEKLSKRLANVARKAHRVLRNGPSSSKKQEQITPVSQTKKNKTGKFCRKKRFA